MSCPNCGGDEVSFPVPDAVSDYLPDERPAATLCTNCLHVSPADEAPDEYPDFTRVSDAFPADGETGAVFACLLALLDRLVVHRSDAEQVATEAERRGVDVLLVLDRLAADDGLDPHLDLARRRRQLEQLI
ncbi:DUF6276 family protein [Halobacterium sp. KA-6]|jgi:hypothetical protein|uniref:DUF6276 family protein n=1 Tax=Halobacterium sp. KA-6 TaxID=2896368 RepID=UPI001E5E1935|nr:DUF6276 family protein [Halobacterium sp. KA-6]MCD2202923.1 DUF6276 family protein [Halobacterium sp. KA-6]